MNNRHSLAPPTDRLKCGHGVTALCRPEFSSEDVFCGACERERAEKAERALAALERFDAALRGEEE